MDVPVNQVGQREATGARFQAADFGGGRAIAQGAQDLGQGLNEAAHNLDKIGQMYDEAAVKQADADDLKKIMELKAKAMSAQGFDAQAAIGDARQQIAEIRRQRLATLHNNRQRQMYADVFDQRNLQLEESFTNHSITQIDKAERGAATERANTYMDYAVDTYGTPEFEKNLNTAMSEVATVNRGMGPDVIGRKQAEVKSQVYSRTISTMLTDPENVQTAKHALETHAKDILPEDEERLRKQLNPILEEDQADTDAGRILSGGDAVPDPLAPTPEKGSTPPGEGEYYPAKPSGKVVPIKPVSASDPLRGKGNVTNNAVQHRERGSGNALDIAAPEGTPIYAPMSGKVIKNFWSDKGGWQVLVEHPNGYVTGYAHLRSKSPLAEGSHVENNIPIGSVGQTGHATGPHVHYTVRTSRGSPKVDPAAIAWNGDVKPDSVKWKEPGLVKYNAEQNTLGAALDRLHTLATRENWSNHRYQNAVQRVRQIAGVQEQLYNDNQQEEYESALTTVVKLGDGLTSISQVPNFSRLSPERQYSIKNIIDGNRKAKEDGGVKANGPQFLRLMGMSQDPAFRQGFLSADLLKETQVTPGERARLLSRQQELKQQPNGALAASLGKADYFSKRYMPPNYNQFQGPKGDALRHDFAERFMAAQERQQNKLGRQLRDDELDSIAKGLMVEVVREGQKSYGFQVLGSGKGGTIDVDQTYTSIPLLKRREIESRLGTSDRRAVVSEFLRSVPR